jgi:hypothetical protein
VYSKADGIFATILHRVSKDSKIYVEVVELSWKRVSLMGLQSLLSGSTITTTKFIHKSKSKTKPDLIIWVGVELEDIIENCDVIGDRLHNHELVAMEKVIFSKHYKE